MISIEKTIKRSLYLYTFLPSLDIDSPGSRLLSRRTWGVSYLCLTVSIVTAHP